MIVARDVYGCHYDELDRDQKRRLTELISLRFVEIDKERDAIEKAKGGS